MADTKSVLNTDDITATIMVVREVLMEYFKGTCVERLTDWQHINQVQLNGSERGFLYIRRELATKDPRIVELKGLPLFTMVKQPDTLILHTAVLNRSPQLKEVRKGLDKFLASHLAGIEVKENKGAVTYAFDS